jgi:hypothetical protein
MLSVPERARPANVRPCLRHDGINGVLLLLGLGEPKRHQEADRVPRTGTPVDDERLGVPFHPEIDDDRRLVVRVLGRDIENHLPIAGPENVLVDVVLIVLAEQARTVPEEVHERLRLAEGRRVGGGPRFPEEMAEERAMHVFVLLRIAP